MNPLWCCRASAVVSVALAGLLSLASLGAVAQNPFVTFAFNPGVNVQTCSSGANTTPISSSPNYLFRSRSPDSGALNCSTDAGGWARFSNDSFRMSYFYVYWPAGHFDFEGFDVRNNTGGPVEISVVSRDGSAQPRGSQTITVPAGTSTVTLSPIQTYVRFSDILIPSVAGLAFNNIRVRQWQPSPPDAPTIGSATAGNASAVVSFTAPANNGGAAITGYTATSTPDGRTGSCSASPCTVNGLTNGQSYTFVVSASNSAGTGDPSQPSNAVTPLSNNADLASIVLSEGTLQPSFAPGTLSYSATVGNPVSAIAFTASPADPAATMTLNGSPITSGVPSSPQALVVGDNAFTIESLAQNGLATRSYSIVVNRQATVPDAPSNLVATPGNAQASIAFAEPGDGGSPIIDYQYQVDGGGWSPSGLSASPILIPGLSNGSLHRIALRAVNALGPGAASAEVEVTPFTLPGAPTGVAASVGDAAAEISFQPPLDDGGAALTGFFVASLPAGPTQQCASSPCTVVGLTNGTAYRFTVAAENAAGRGPASLPSDAVTPVGPQAALSVSATPATIPVGGTSTLSTTGGSGEGALGYVLSSGETICSLQDDQLTGLAVGVCTVTATKAADAAHTATSASVEVTVVLAEQSIDFPALPDRDFGTDSFALSATGGASGLPVVFASTSASVCATSGPQGATLTLLSAGVCSIRASQAGNSTYAPAPDVLRQFVVRPVLPGAPEQLGASPGNAELTITWQAPAQDGGSPITDYSASAIPSGQNEPVASCDTTTQRCVIRGLVNGTAYSVRVIARNSAGSGPAASLAQPITPYAAPDAPTDLQVDAGRGTAMVSWSAPLNTGGLAITRYTATAMPGGQSCTVSGAPPPTRCMIGGLVPGVTYTFSVVAENAGGAVGPPATFGGGAAVPVSPTVVPSLSAGGALLLLIAMVLVSWVGLRSRGL